MARIKLDSGPNNARKLRLKATKHALWIVFSLWTGFTFVGYFTPIRELWGEIITLTLSASELFWVLFYGFATYGNAGWLREQVCKYMCPYARFQSAMFDADTLIVSYDTERGEPRGSRKKKTVDHKAEGLGDCIDCKMCVQVCPVGIDIRNGLQYECIGCAACIDACDEVMDKMSYPRADPLHHRKRAQPCVSGIAVLVTAEAATRNHVWRGAGGGAGDYRGFAVAASAGHRQYLA